MVRRRQIEKRTDRLRQLGGDNAKSVAEQRDIHMHSLLTRCELSVFGVRRFGTRDSRLESAALSVREKQWCAVYFTHT